MPELRERLFEQMGIRLPAVRVRVGDPQVPSADFVVLVNEVEAARGVVPPESVFCSLEPVQLRDGGLEVAEGHDPLTGRQGGWIDRAHADRARSFGCKVLEPPGYVVASLEETVRAHASEFVSVQQVQDLLDSLESTAPALVRSTVPKHASSDGRSIDVFVVSPVIEDAVRTSVHTTEQGSFLALDPEMSRDIVEAVSAEVRTFPYTEQRVPVLITQSDVRRFLRRLIDIDHPRVAVLSYQEVDPSFTIHPVGEIRVGG